ncbi:hypothetical protein ACFQHV_19530 [Promicromonospora thailandica]|uniref:Uncharacterized protein n=1 Tax=Promicromonospora thailandica TaxID=765201 RepID=A0A9X2FX90_9MICO|nr:hypothetical protein [Promicromonospora thailandica]MCP2262972.1 hypothetical protein [Promicromonospora thailandica]
MDAGRATVTVAKAIVCAAAVVTVYLISTVRLDRGFVQSEGTPTTGLIAAVVAWLLVVWVLLYRDDGVRGVRLGLWNVVAVVGMLVVLTGIPLVLTFWD